METSRVLKLLSWFFIIFPLSIGSAIAKTKVFYGFGSEIDRYIQESAQRYQISEVMLRGLIKMEDGWYSKISPTGATGVGQFTVGTWNWLAATERGRAIGMQFVTSRNRGTRFDPRHNKRINTLATGLYARWHVEQFAERGIKVNDENLYMAHNIGLDGLHRAILGISTRDDIKNMRRNGMKTWMSVKDFLAYQKGRYVQHKNEANFISSKQYSVQTTQTKAANLVAPDDKKMVWIHPQNDGLVWINPQ
ncbi:lytic murein transglycosylase [Actinobacillus pleuropneumoniae]|uniref:lytic murein transglycosylase n=1 Tax=Actinobacillus pleuropneumoniae TaxID=715 RepID=UPI003B01DD9C